MTTIPRVHRAVPPLPHPIRLGLTQAALEMKIFMRAKDMVFFTLGLPLMFLLVFGLVFAGELEGSDVGVGQWFTPGIIAASVLSAGIVNLATSMAIERHDGTLRRLALTPLPTSSYLIGKITMTFATAVGMTVVLLGVGVALFDVTLPSEGARWLTFGWVFGLGVVAASVMGIAMSSIPRSAKSASAVFNLPFLGLMFISGVFIESNSIPEWLRTVAGVFPLRWLASGMRAVFLPAEFERVVEPGGSYELGIGAAVLAAWVVVGFLVALVTFRWGRERRR
ncbi:MAG: ABC transporter permease [Acidimicrobiia bacterium]|nr:ABC transporter permease [Acidimicrobiia bacterium]MDH4308718.1 ABC transporter permease [Acidimicrobiia bacterium]MDH5294191.1 ABC transporter permease [Acidimicrobiia bacterium]